MAKKVLALIQNNLLIAAFFVLGGISIVSNLKHDPQESPPTHTSTMKSVDTFIPRGFVLVPLEIANSDSLASLVGDLGGVVDLYLAASPTQKGGLKVASKVKLLRAPLNPQQYAVLVHDQQSPRLLAYAGPFIAVVQNPEEKGAQLTTTSSRHLRIDYHN